MPIVQTETLNLKIDDVLRPLGVTRSFRSYRTLRECITLIFEQEDRLESVQKEIYEPVARCSAANGPLSKAPSAAPQSWHGRSIRSACRSWPGIHSQAVLAPYSFWRWCTMP